MQTYPPRSSTSLRALDCVGQARFIRAVQSQTGAHWSAPSAQGGEGPQIYMPQPPAHGFFLPVGAGAPPPTRSNPCEAAARATPSRPTVASSRLKSYAAAIPILIICLRCHPAPSGRVSIEPTEPSAKKAAGSACCSQLSNTPSPNKRPHRALARRRLKSDTSR